MVYLLMSKDEGDITMKVLLTSDYAKPKITITKECYSVGVNRNLRKITGYDIPKGKKQKVLFYAYFDEWYEIKVVDDEGIVTIVKEASATH